MAEQILVNKRSRKLPRKQGFKKKLSGTVDLTSRIRSSLTAVPRRLTERLYIVEGGGLGSCKLSRDAGFRL